MQKNAKRVLSLILALVLCLSAMPLSVFAADEAATEISEPVQQPDEGPVQEQGEDTEPTPESGMADESVK